MSSDLTPASAHLPPISTTPSHASHTSHTHGTTSHGTTSHAPKAAHHESTRHSAATGHETADHAAALHGAGPRTLAPAKAAGPEATTFAMLNLAAPILRALNDEKYTTPTPIQAKAIPPAAEGRDLLGCAQTGTGKTAAFALPILHRLLTAAVDKTHRGPVTPRALILSPTRELANQIGESFGAYGRYSGLSYTTVYGGVSQFHQVRAFQRGVDILVATPGRLMDLMQQRVVDLTKVQIFVLDEADRMLDMGFIQPIRRIAASLPKTRQTLLFSATMPREIVGLADSLLRDPVKVSVTPVASAAPLIDQLVYMIGRSRKQSLLEHLIVDGKIGRALVFTRTKRGADVVTRRLTDSGITSVAIHGNKAQNQRQRALDGFKTGRCRVLVATDVAARGIDIDNVSHVINYDVPNEAEAYVHRIGRTGRAGLKGIAITMCDDDERGLLRDIERLIGKKVPLAAPIADLPVREHLKSPDRGSDQPRDHERAHGQGGYPRSAPRGGGSGGGGGGDRYQHSSGHAPARADHGKPRGERRGSAGYGGGDGGAPAHSTGHTGAKKAHRGQSGAPRGPVGHPLGSGGPPSAGPRTGMNHFRGKSRRTSGGR